MRLFLLATVICLSRPVVAAMDGALQPPTQMPNIVILLADDLGYGETGVQGSTDIPTPHIDSIAQTGIRFTQAYVTAPNCSPSRAGLLSGRIPTRFGYEFNPIGARNEDPTIGLPSSVVTLPELLQERGYTTGLIGKWHLGGSAAYHPFRHGFDEFFGFMHEGHYFVPPPYNGVTTMLRRVALPGGGKGRWVSDHLIYSTHMGHSEPDYDADNPIIRAGQPEAEAEYLTDAFTREGVDFIRRHHDKPFFLLVAYNAVHSPLQAKTEHMERFSRIEDVHRRIFAGMLASLDESVGRILATIREAGVEQDTLLVFLSDNGGPTRELTSGNQPLRGEKGQMYEGGIRVPFLMRRPGTLQEGAVYEHPVSSTDLFATAAHLAGAEISEDLDGVDLIPYLTGENPNRPHETLFWRQGSRAALRHGDWKLVSNARKRTASSWELYDLSRDIGESDNLAASHREKLGELMRRWEGLNREMTEPLF